MKYTSLLLVIPCIINHKALAQRNKFEFSAGVNTGVNFSQVTTALNDGVYMSFNPSQDYRIQEGYITDYHIGIGYTLNNKDIVSIIYRRYNTRQDIGNGSADPIIVKTRNPYNSFGSYYKKYWGNRRSGFFSQHGLNILFDNSSDKTSFNSLSRDKMWTYDYDRLINYKSNTGINFIFSNAVGFSQYISPHFSIEYYMDYNLGVRNLSTNSIVFKSRYYTDNWWGYNGSATGMNKGDKIGIGIQLNYKF